MILFVTFGLIFLLSFAIPAFSTDEEPLEEHFEDGVNGVEPLGGETVDVGEFKVFVPKGWMPIPVMDAFGKNPSLARTDKLQLFKGAESQFDILTKPGLEIVFYGKTQGVMPPKTFYKDVEELKPTVIGDHVWGGFKATAFMGKKLVLLWEDTGVFQYQVNLWPEGEGSSVDLNDPELLKILGSISPNAVD